MNNTIKYLDKLNSIKNRYSIPYTKENMKEEHYVEIMYEELSIEMIKEIERLNNIIKRFEEDLREVYLTFGEFSEEYTEKKIRELKGDDK